MTWRVEKGLVLYSCDAPPSQEIDQHGRVWSNGVLTDKKVERASTFFDLGCRCGCVRRKLDKARKVR